MERLTRRVGLRHAVGVVRADGHRPAVRCRALRRLPQPGGAAARGRQGEGARRGAARAPSRRPAWPSATGSLTRGWATWSARARGLDGGGHVAVARRLPRAARARGIPRRRGEDLTDEWRAISPRAPGDVPRPARADVRRLGEARYRVRRALTRSSSGSSRPASSAAALQRDAMSDVVTFLIRHARRSSSSTYSPIRSAYRCRPFPRCSRSISSSSGASAGAFSAVCVSPVSARRS